MITLEYDALNGMALPEGMVKPFVTEFIRLNKTKDIKLIFGQELILQEFRLALINGVFPVNAFRLMFDDREVKFTYDFKIEEWPKGLCDYSDHCIKDIVSATITNVYQKLVD
jgi:hypothetical protein